MLLHVAHESTAFKRRLGASDIWLVNAGATSIRAALWLQPGQAQDTQDLRHPVLHRCRRARNSALARCQQPESFVVVMQHSFTSGSVPWRCRPAHSMLS